MSAPKRGKRRTRGTGSVQVRTRKDGTKAWYAVYRFDGRDRWELAGSDRLAAEDLVAKRTRQIRVGRGDQLISVSFGAYAQQWLQGKKAKGIKASTLQDYEIIINRHLNPAFDGGALAISHITARRVQNYIVAKHLGSLPVAGGAKPKLAGKTVRNQLAVLYGICQLGVRDGKLRINPVSLVDRPNVSEKEPLFLSRKQIDRLVGAMDEDWRVITRLMALTGLRLGEARALRWGDVDENAMKIRVRNTVTRHRRIEEAKTKAGKRDVPMSAQLLEDLKTHRKRLSEWQARSQFVFPDGRGAVIDGDFYRVRVFKPAIKKAKLSGDDARLKDLRVHDLRHSYCSLMIREKPAMHPRHLQAVVGHADFQTTMRIYSHVAPEHLDEVGTIY